LAAALFRRAEICRCERRRRRQSIAGRIDDRRRSGGKADFAGDFAMLGGMDRIMLRKMRRADENADARQQADRKARNIEAGN
jgi:hypothetical protein